jgi:hypothetical protein
MPSADKTDGNRAALQGELRQIKMAIERGLQQQRVPDVLTHLGPFVLDARLPLLRGSDRCAVIRLPHDRLHSLGF